MNGNRPLEGSIAARSSTWMTALTSGIPISPPSRRVRVAPCCGRTVARPQHGATRTRRLGGLIGMPLVKAVIQVLDRAAIDPSKGLLPFIPVQFNPTEYTLEKGAQLAEITIPGIDSPILQF